ncbi:hypothetical protein D3C87_1762130 [compost metagenome]
MRQRFQVERQVGGRQAEFGGDLARHAAVRRCSHEQPEDVQPDARGERFEDDDSGVFIHVANTTIFVELLEFTF